MYTPRHTGLYVIRTSYLQQALQHILQKSSYNYPKRIDISTMTLMQPGPGILWAEGTWHMLMSDFDCSPSSQDPCISATGRS